MKIYEFDNDLREDQAFFDLSMAPKIDPNDDEFGKANDDQHRKPTITLRHVNKLKHMKSAQQEEHEKRKALVSVMYGLPPEGEEGV